MNMDVGETLENMRQRRDKNLWRCERWNKCCSFVLGVMGLALLGTMIEFAYLEDESGKLKNFLKTAGATLGFMLIWSMITFFLGVAGYGYARNR